METRGTRRRKVIDKLCSDVDCSDWDAVKKCINEANDISKQTLKVCAMHALCQNRLRIVPPNDIILLLQDAINTRNVKGLTPLMMAVLKGNSTLLLKLIEYGADASMVRKHNRMNITPYKKNPLDALCMAIGYKYDFDVGDADIMILNGLTSEAFAALIYPGRVNKVTFGHTPLQYAVEEENVTAIIELCKAGSDTSVKLLYDMGEIPFDRAVTSDVILSNAEAMFHLIPHTVHISPLILMTYLHSLQKRPQLLDLPHTPEVLSRVLLTMKQDDFFTLNQLHITKGPVFRVLICTPTPSLLHEIIMVKFNLNVDLLHALSKLVRYGLAARKKPTLTECSYDLSSYKGRLYSRPWSRIVEDTNDKFEEAAERMHEIDALFSDPLPLFHQCCITVRRHLQYPKHKNLYLLPLPPLVRDQVMFPDLCREICEQIKRNC